MWLSSRKDGYLRWNLTLQVGMLSLQHPSPEISFQEEQAASFDKLLQEVKSRLTEKTEGNQKDAKEKKNSVDEDQDNTSFQVQ